MRKTLMIVATALGLQGAHAADMPALRGGYSDLGPVRPIWDGFYIGGQASQGWSQISPSAGYNGGIVTDYGNATGLGGYQYSPLSRASGQKAGYGGFVGYNSQFEDVVIGIEGNYTHTSLSANSLNPFATPVGVAPPYATTSNVAVNVKDFGSIRLRGGYMVGSFLPYAFVGASAASVDITQTAGVTFAPAVAPPLPGLRQVTQTDKIVYGYSAGVGIDVLLIGGLFARAEYEYTRFTSQVDTSINTVRVGLGYKF